MARTWLSGLMLRWTPILTYTRRRQALLDWVEKNTRPIGFFDDDAEGTVGFAFGPDMRMLVSRAGVLISSGASGESLAHVLDEPLNGVLEVLEPRNLSLDAIAGMTSQPLAVRDYATATRRFAQRAAGNIRRLNWDPTDAAILMDVEDARFRIQLEYGIVTRSELLERLQSPSLGRLASFLEAPHPDQVATAVIQEAEISVFLDGALRPKERMHFTTTTELWSNYESARSELEEFAQSLSVMLSESSEGETP